jgi:hypothetical protein
MGRSADLHSGYEPATEWGTAAPQCVAEADGWEVIDLSDNQPPAHDARGF